MQPDSISDHLAIITFVNSGHFCIQTNPIIQDKNYKSSKKKPVAERPNNIQREINARSWKLKFS